MELYFTPGACSLAPHIVLREAQLSFELNQVDLATRKTTDGADFTAVNLKGQVPALVLDDGSVLTEVPAIVQYLADRHPEADLAPAPGTLARYRLQEWLNFVTAELHKSLGTLFRPDLPAGWEAIVKQTVATKLDYLERHLAEQDYLLDNRFSVADSYAFAIINWTHLFDIDLAPWRNVQRYMERIAARPAVREAMRAEGLAVAGTGAANEAEYTGATGDPGVQRA